MQASEVEVRQVLEALPLHDRVRIDIAALNGPGQTVISGDADVVARLLAAMQPQGRTCKNLTVSHAFHSPHMDGMLLAFRAVARAVTYQVPTIPIISNVTGKWADTTQGELITAEYWVRHVRGAVRFSEGLSALESLGVNTYVECGPHGVLCGLVEAALVQEASRVTRLPSLRKDRDEAMVFAEALGALHVVGQHIDWNAVFDGLGACRVDLPTYAFQHQRYWLDAPQTPTPNFFVANKEPHHPLVLARVDSPDGRTFFSCRIGPDTTPWVREHQVYGTIVLPGVAFAELALHVAHRLGLERIAELVCEKPLLLEPGAARQLLLTVESGAGEERAWTVHSRSDDVSAWIHHVSGRLASNHSHESTSAPNWPPEASEVPLSGVYERIASMGLEYGPAFRAMRRIYRTDTEVFVEVSLAAPVPAGVSGEARQRPPERPSLRNLQTGGFALHPVLLQLWLGASKPNRLTWLTRGAVAASPSDDIHHLAHAPLWGLARGVFSERPNVPLQCVDVDRATHVTDIVRALSCVAEPEIAIRRGTAFIPRLMQRARSEHSAALVSKDWSSGTVVITGGLGEIGAHVARHFVRACGVRHVVLLSRRGAGTAHAQALENELIALGASSVRIEAVDTSDEIALRRCLVERAGEPEIRLCVHAAGLLEDAALGEMTADQLHRVLLPKVDGAWNLHQILNEKKLPVAVVLFSSLSSLLGAPRNANYVAANAFLDALAFYRNAHGLPTISLAWGLWAGAGLGARFSETEHSRMRRNGVFPMATAAGMAMLDAALASHQSLLVPAHLDLPTLNAAAAEGRLLPSMFRGLVRPARAVPRAMAGATNSFVEDLAACASQERLVRVLDLVRTEIAAVAGLGAASEVPVDQPVQDLGFDSLMNVDLRNRLASSIGKSISITVSLDFPKPMDLARHLLLDVLGLRGARSTSEMLLEQAPVQTSQSSSSVVSDASKGLWIRSTRPDAQMRLFCIPFAGGGPSAFHSWRKYIPENIDLCPVAIPGREARGNESPLRDMSTLVAQIVQAIAPWVDRPYAIYGHSMGSVVSYEVIRELRRRGAPMPVRLFIGGYPAPLEGVHSPVAHIGGDGVSDAAFVHAVNDEFSAIPAEILANPDLLARLVPALRADFHIAARYEFVAADPLAVPFTAFYGRDDRFGSRERVEAWRQHSGCEFVLHDVPGGHFFHVDPVVPRLIANLLQG